MHGDRSTMPIKSVSRLCFVFVPSVSSFLVEIDFKCTSVSINMYCTLIFRLRSLSFSGRPCFCSNSFDFFWPIFLLQIWMAFVTNVPFRQYCWWIFYFALLYHYHDSSITMMFVVHFWFWIDDDGGGDNDVDDGVQQSICCQYIIAHVIENIIPSILICESSVNCSIFLPVRISIILQWYHRIHAHKYMNVHHHYMLTIAFADFTHSRTYTTVTVVRIEGENGFALIHV